MRMTRKELGELIDSLSPESPVRTQLESFYQSFEERGRIEVSVDWTPEHQRFYDELEQLRVEQELEVHPKLLPRLRGWIDSAINRGSRCVMIPERGCPCQEPVDFGCPLLRRKDKQH